MSKEAAMKLLAAGDWHLGSGTSLGRTPGDRLQDQRDVVIRIAALAAERSVDGVLLAGDLLHGPTTTPEQLEVIADFAAALPCPVLSIVGNSSHDLAMRSTHGLAIFSHIPGITVVSRPQVVPFAGCAVACLPWVSPARLIAKTNGGGDRDSLNETMAAKLVEIAGDLRRECEERNPEWPCVLLGHWSVSGASLPSGLPVDQLREPVLPVEMLDELAFDHIVMGHIHHVQSIGERGFYVGSPMPLNFGEDLHADGHGVWIVHTGETQDIDAYAAEFVPVESRRLKQLRFDLTALDFDGHDALTEYEGILDANAWPDVADAIVKVTFQASRSQQRRMDLAALRMAILDAGAHTVKIEVETVREDRARVEAVREDLDPLEAFDLWVGANEVDELLAGRARDRMREDLWELA